MDKRTRQILIAAGVLVVLLAVAAGVWMRFGPKGTGGTKQVTVRVVYADKTQKAFPLRTNAEFLGRALEEAGLAQGEQGPYGLYIKTVDGVTADESKQQWWCLTKGGETVMTGADATPVADGDVFELTLTEGY